MYYCVLNTACVLVRMHNLFACTTCIYGRMTGKGGQDVYYYFVIGFDQVHDRALSMCPIDEKTYVT